VTDIAENLDAARAHKEFSTRNKRGKKREAKGGGKDKGIQGEYTRKVAASNLPTSQHLDSKNAKRISGAHAKKTAGAGRAVSER